MDRPLESVDQQASSAALSTALEKQFDEGLFQKFMAKNPVQDSHSLTKEQYLAKGRDEKLELMKNYYTMKNGEPLLFLSFLSEKCCKVRLGQDRLGQSETEIYWVFLSFFLATETVPRPGVIQKANMLYLTKETINKDQSLKMQHLYSADDKPTLKTERNC